MPGAGPVPELRRILREAIRFAMQTNASDCASQARPLKDEQLISFRFARRSAGLNEIEMLLDLSKRQRELLALLRREA